MRNIARLGLTLTLALSLFACKFRKAPPAPAPPVGSAVITSASTEAAPTSTTPTPAPAPAHADDGSARLSALESHLTFGSDWGSDPLARRVAAHAFAALKDQKLSRREVAIAVEIIPSRPARQVVMVIQLKHLKDESAHNRKVLLSDVSAVISDDLEPTDYVTVGIRGTLFYGTVAAGLAEDEWKPTVGKMVDPTPLKFALNQPRR